MEGNRKAEFGRDGGNGNQRVARMTWMLFVLRGQRLPGAAADFAE
jgi:hypothetical protein